MRRILPLALILPVLAVLGCSKSSPTSPGASVTTVSHPWPADGDSTVFAAPTLSWSGSGRNGSALTYDLYLDTSTPPAARVAQDQDSTTFHCTGLTAGTRYYWKVEAKDGQGAVTGSATWSFTTNAGGFTPGMIAVAAGSFAYNSATIGVSAFHVDRYETTYDAWTDVCGWAAAHGYPDLAPGSNGLYATDPHQPVGMVNFYDIAKWCNARSEREGLTPVYYADAAHTTVYRSGSLDLINEDVLWTADGYRLPTEAEWRYAAHGGVLSRGYPYSGADIVDNVAWCEENSGGATHTVGTKTANELGIFDLNGNVDEILWDWFGPTFPAGGTTDPRGPAAAQTCRVLAGGNVGAPGSVCNLGRRAYDADGPGHRNPAFGFRCVRR